jgi:hypothetical protein
MKSITIPTPHDAANQAAREWYGLGAEELSILRLAAVIRRHFPAPVAPPLPPLQWQEIRDILENKFYIEGDGTRIMRHREAADEIFHLVNKGNVPAPTNGWIPTTGPGARMPTKEDGYKTGGQVLMSHNDGSIGVFPWRETWRTLAWQRLPAPYVPPPQESAADKQKREDEEWVEKRWQKARFETRHVKEWMHDAIAYARGGAK